MDEQCGKSTNHIALLFDVPLTGCVYRAIQVITFFSSRTKLKLLRHLKSYKKLLFLQFLKLNLLYTSW